MSDIKEFLDGLIDDTAALRDKLESRLAVIETPAVDRTLWTNFNIYGCSSALDLSTTTQDVAGCTTGSFTPSIDMYAFVGVSMNYNLAVGTAACNAGDTLRGQLNVVYSATDHLQTPNASMTADSGVGTYNVQKWYKIALTANVPYTLKIVAANTVGNRGRVTPDTQLTVWLFPR